MEKIWLGKYHFPAKCHFACCKSQRFYYIIGWWFTAWAWSCHNCPKRNYLEDQNRPHDEDKMLPLLCRILILRKISSEYVSNNEGQKLSSWWPQKLPVCKFSILYFDRSTGTSSSLSTKMTFTLKMTTFWVFSNTKGWYFFFAIIIHFRCKL